MEGRLAEARARLLALSQRAELEGEPLRWFEELYSGADRDSDEIPWARMEAMPEMVEWIAQRPEVVGRALVIGCGLGDDAEWLAAAGFDVVAFDLSETCIRWCEERFPSSSVNYSIDDMLNLPEGWQNSFDLVVEIHTLQAMPEDIRDQAIVHIPPLLTEGGHLLCIGRLLADRIPSEPSPPWPLTRTWLESRFSSLEHVSFQHFVREDTPGIDRYVSAWKR